MWSYILNYFIMSKLNIDLKYMIPLVGEYNAGVSFCPECNHEPETIVPYIIGFSNLGNSTMVVVECPKCFTKWYFHSRTEFYYNHLLQYIEYGKSNHFTK